MYHDRPKCIESLWVTLTSCPADKAYTLAHISSPSTVPDLTQQYFKYLFDVNSSLLLLEYNFNLGPLLKLTCCYIYVFTFSPPPCSFALIGNQVFDCYVTISRQFERFIDWTGSLFPSLKFDLRKKNKKSGILFQLDSSLRDYPWIDFHYRPEGG